MSLPPAHGHGPAAGGGEEPQEEAAADGGGRAALLGHQGRGGGGAAHLRGGGGEDVRPWLAQPPRRGLQRRPHREAVVTGKRLGRWFLCFIGKARQGNFIYMVNGPHLYRVFIQSA